MRLDGKEKVDSAGRCRAARSAHTRLRAHHPRSAGTDEKRCRCDLGHPPEADISQGQRPPTQDSPTDQAHVSLRVQGSTNCAKVIKCSITVKRTSNEKRSRRRPTGRTFYCGALSSRPWRMTIITPIAGASLSKLSCGS